MAGDSQVATPLTDSIISYKVMTRGRLLSRRPARHVSGEQSIIKLSKQQVSWKERKKKKVAAPYTYTLKNQQQNVFSFIISSRLNRHDDRLGRPTGWLDFPFGRLNYLQADFQPPTLITCTAFMMLLKLCRPRIRRGRVVYPQAVVAPSTQWHCAFVVSRE